jgi:hypothetical protein
MKLNILRTYDTHGVVHTDIQEGINILNTPYDRSDAFDDDDEEAERES